MDAENLSVDDSRETEIVEYFCAVAPDCYAAVLPKTLVIESVHLSNLTRLMVAANKSDAIGVADLILIKYVCNHFFSQLNSYSLLAPKGEEMFQRNSILCRQNRP